MKVNTQLLAQMQLAPAQLVVMSDAQLVLKLPPSTNALPVRKVTSTLVLTKLAMNVLIAIVKLAVQVALLSVLLARKDTSFQAVNAQPVQQVLIVVLVQQLMQQLAQLAQLTIS